MGRPGRTVKERPRLAKARTEQAIPQDQQLTPREFWDSTLRVLRTPSADAHHRFISALGGGGGVGGSVGDSA